MDFADALNPDDMTAWAAKVQADNTVTEGAEGEKKS